MGDLKVIRLSTKEDKSNYIHQLVKDIDALDASTKGLYQFYKEKI